MKQKYFVAAQIITTLLFANPAYADVRTFTGDDKHLYLNEKMDKLPAQSLFSGWSVSGADALDATQGASPLMRGVSTLDGELFVSQGPFKISNERFFELLSQSSVAPGYLAKYRGMRESPNVLWPALLSLGVGGLGGSLTYFGATGFNQQPLLWSGIGLLAVGGLGLLYTGFLYFSGPSTPALDAFETYEAIKAYNRKLDSQTNP